MNEVTLQDKIQLTSSLLTLRDSIWSLQRRLRIDNNEINSYVSNINNLIYRYDKIYKTASEYRRFNELSQQNKYDNLISIIKVMNRLNIKPCIDINLIDDFDFDKIWETINDHDDISMTKDEYENAWDRIEFISEKLIEIDYNHHLNYAENLRELFVR